MLRKLSQMIKDSSIFFMSQALKQAKLAESMGEVPIGAVLVKEGHIIAESGNETLSLPDPTAHAEIQVLRKAASILNEPRLESCDLYVTLEPCPMCAQAISIARIRRLYYGAYDPKGGGIDHGPRIFNHSTCHHIPEIYGGILEKDCAELLINFFHLRR